MFATFIVNSLFIMIAFVSYPFRNIVPGVQAYSSFIV